MAGPYGLLLKLTHTGLAKESIHISDVRDGIDVVSLGFRKPGAIYVPTPAKGGVSLLVYSGDVAISFEGPKGGIRQFVEGGYLLAEFVIGSYLAPVLGSVGVQEEGTTVVPSATLINFVGAGVTASSGGPGLAIVTIPGGSGTSSHSALTAPSLVWTASGHTGTANQFAIFDGSGAAAYMTISAGGNLGGTYPNPTVTDLTMTGQVRGDVLYFDGANWVVLHPGTSGKVLTTQGAGADPIWATSGSGTTDHTLLTNLPWAASGHTGTAGSLATFNGAGASSFATGVSNGDILYFNGTTWVRLPPGTVAGNPLTTQTAGSPPVWDNAIAVNTISESTVGNGVQVNTVRNYGKSASNPVSPLPTDGDIYYNTALRMQMVYDGLRSKWLSVESAEFHFGRDGSVPAGVYYRAVDGRVMSSTLGWYAVRSGTVVSLGYTRSDSDAATFEIVSNGSPIATVASSATGGRDISLNADFTFGQVLAALNQAGGNTTSDVIAYIRVKWRV